MSVFNTPFFCLIFSLILTTLLCSPIRRLACRLGAIDRPDHLRKGHTAPTPRLGGLALFLGCFVTAICFGVADLPLLLGMMLLTLGLAVDDIQGMSACQKLSVQIFAALPTAASLMRGGRGPFEALFALLVLLILCNAFNLIDGLDGLCAGCGAILSLALAFLCSDRTAMLCFLLAGGCFGFLPHNLRQRKQFLGDCGAGLIGFLLGYCLVTSHTAFSLSLPLILLYPLLELITSTVRRLLMKKSPLSADRGHFHHRLLDLGYGRREAALCLVLLQGYLAMAALCLPYSLGSAVGIFVLFFLLLWWIHRSAPKKAAHPIK